MQVRQLQAWTPDAPAMAQILLWSGQSHVHAGQGTAPDISAPPQNLDDHSLGQGKRGKKE